MEITVFEPKVVAAWSLPMKEVRIMPISDIQYGAQGCDVDRLKRHIKWGVDNDFYFIGLGDYLDVMSPSNRRKWVEAGFYDSVKEAMDDKIGESLKELQRVLKPSIGRWLGMLTGHHMYEFGDGTTSDTRLASFLQTKFMGDGAAVSILQFKHPTAHLNRALAKIWFHHGRGSSRIAGGSLRMLDYISNSFFADVYLMGHQHKKETAKKPWIDYDVGPNGEIHWRARNRVLATTGGFLKGYEMNTHDPKGLPAASYVEKAMLTPTALGGVTIYIRPKVVNGRVVMDIDITS